MKNVVNYINLELPTIFKYFTSVSNSFIAIYETISMIFLTLHIFQTFVFSKHHMASKYESMDLKLGGLVTTITIKILFGGILGDLQYSALDSVIRVGAQGTTGSAEVKNLG